MQTGLKLLEVSNKLHHSVTMAEKMTSKQVNITAEQVEGLFRPGEAHRDLYASQDIFRAEMQHLFRQCWLYVGHDSQVPNRGDYIATELADQPVLMVRDREEVKVFHNRCPHKGTKLVLDAAGQAGPFFRCPYHAWTFRTDGSLRSIPHPQGYDEERLHESAAGCGLSPVENLVNYRGFIFARLASQGIDFDAFFGGSLSTLDNMIDRSPEGRLSVAGPPLRYMHRCNWKMLVENQTDTCHPMVAHESSAGTVVDLWSRIGGNSKKPMAVEIYAPFLSDYSFYDKMGIRIWPNGHGHTGVTQSIHSNYSEIPGYFDQMIAAYGRERAEAILSESRHNTVFFPNIMVKGPIQSLRLFKPLAADRTLVESWIFRLDGAPDMLLERTAAYNRLINAPTSIVGHDDLEMYERAQEGLSAGGNDWVNMQRDMQADEMNFDGEKVVIGTSELQMRNQFDAWRKFMLESIQNADHKAGAGA